MTLTAYGLTGCVRRKKIKKGSDCSVLRLFRLGIVAFTLSKAPLTDGFLFKPSFRSTHWKLRSGSRERRRKRESRRRCARRVQPLPLHTNKATSVATASLLPHFSLLTSFPLRHYLLRSSAWTCYYILHTASPFWYVVPPIPFARSPARRASNSHDAHDTASFYSLSPIR